jgi:NitT/TauT family transport system ATP-binding protein
MTLPTAPDAIAAATLPSPNLAGVALRLGAVEKIFPNSVRALDPITLDIPAGQFLSILGPSGCGKSTLLRLIAGLDRPTAGAIDFSDRAIRGSHAIAFVFQDAHLLPWRTVLQNVALPFELMHRSSSYSVHQAIEQVGLGDAIHRYPAQLSGGMRMRVSLARALVTDPELLLLDEPFAALDEITRQRLDDQLRELWTRRRMTVIFVTHSIVEAAFLAERAIVMSRRPGRIILDHTLDLPAVRTPELRTDPVFAREMRTLFDALGAGEAL